MVSVRFRSVYTETDRYGNQRSEEHSFEAVGSGREVCMAINTVMDRVQLPGTTPRYLTDNVTRYLSSR